MPVKTLSEAKVTESGLEVSNITKTNLFFAGEIRKSYESFDTVTGIWDSKGKVISVNDKQLTNEQQETLGFLFDLSLNDC